jgi:polysaccharide deacetylase family protein (PEP-CTERM system associated)
VIPPARPHEGPGSTVGSEAPFALSVDVEDYFQVQAFARYVSRDAWDQWPSRVERNTRILLNLFDETGATATFFTLGWVARKYPGLVREIAARGHEVASHGMFHQMLTEQTPETFRVDARDSRAVLEDTAGVTVLGFRAPSYSVNRSTLWAIDVLAEAGYQYDSSVYPIRRKRYGFPEGPTLPGMQRGDRRELAEFPLPTLPIGPFRLPVLAGAYLRLLPAAVSMHALRFHKDRRQPLVVNVHPWELDPEQPTVAPSRLKAWAHYTRVGATEGILRKVLRHARFRDVATRLREIGLIKPLGGDRVAAS